MEKNSSINMAPQMLPFRETEPFTGVTKSALLFLRKKKKLTGLKHPEYIMYLPIGTCK